MYCSHSINICHIKNYAERSEKCLRGVSIIRRQSEGLKVFVCNSAVYAFSDIELLARY